MFLTHKQYLWLWSRGGRTVKDVIVRNGELGVFMSSYGSVDDFFPIPNDIGINLYMNQGHVHDRTGTGIPCVSKLG